MAVRTSRLLSALAAGGVLAGSLFLGTGAASAAPAAPGGKVVPAACGQTVTARSGDTVRVVPKIGVPFTQRATPGMAPVAMTIGGLLCQVKVNVLVPVAAPLVRVAPPVGTLTTGITEKAGKLTESTGLTPKAQQQSAAAAPAPRMVPMVPMVPVQRMPSSAPVATLPTGAPAAGLSPTALAANAPLFAPTFGNELPSSFLSSGSPAPGVRLDAGSLFGSAFPGLRAGAPAYMGYGPASAVTTASQVQALPVDGLSDGVGIPAILAVLALSGAAAFAVRRMVLGRGLVPALAGAGAAASGSSLPAPQPAAVPEPATVAAFDAAEVTAIAPAIEDAPTTVGAIAPVDDAPTTVGEIAPVDDAPTTVGEIAPVDDAPTTVGEIAPVPAEVTGVIDVDAPETGIIDAAPEATEVPEASASETTGVLSATGSN